MEISARNSSTKIIAVIILSLTTLVFILGFAVAWLALLQIVGGDKLIIPFC